MTDLGALVAKLSPQAREALARHLAEAGTPVPAARTAEPIAVVGIGCRLPGGVHDPRQLWDLLVSGRDAVREVPADRWDVDSYYDPDPATPGRTNSRWGGFLDEVSGFDAEYFGVTPREAESMDPQQRLLLEVTVESLENAGIPPESLRGSRTGVFVGLSSMDYLILGVEQHASANAYTATGNPHSIAVGRLSYFLDARGPSVAVDTACSSSLVAIHLASQSLRTGESEVAIAGGVQLMLTPHLTIALGKWAALSSEGRCKSFDASADGFVRGEGCGVVILKRLSDAVRDGDRIVAVVRGSAVNSDGRSQGLTAPSAAAQRDVLKAALSQAGVEAGSVGLIETHGTGTVLGDPIEFDALSQVYGTGAGRCALGSLKTNLGHLEAAAGVAGFVKAALALRAGSVPPNLHFRRWNPNIDPSDTRFFVPTEACEWPVPDGRRLAAVSSFGLGGTNAHVVLEQAPATAAEPSDTAEEDGRPTVFVLRARTEERVRAAAGRFAEWLRDAGSAARLSDIAFTLARRHAQGRFAGAVVARSHSALADGLANIAAGSTDGVLLTETSRGTGGQPVWLFSGRGAPWPGAGQRLLAEEPAFANAVHELDQIFVACVGFSLREALTTGENLANSDRTRLVLFGLQLALARLWQHYGVRPAAVIGHGTGNVAAAVVAGALRVENGLAVLARLSLPYKEEPGGIPATAPEIPFHSMLSDDPRAVPSFDGTNWADEELGSEALARFVAAAASEGHRTFVEVSVHPVLADAVQEILSDEGATDATVIATLRRDSDDTREFRTRLTAAALAGCPVELDQLVPNGQLVDLPPTPWQRSTFWFQGNENGTPVDVHPMLGVHVTLPEPAGNGPAPRPGRHAWQADVGTDAVPWLMDHRIYGRAVLAQSVYMEVALAAAVEAYGEPPARIRLNDLELHQLLTLDEHTTLVTTLVPGEEGDARVEMSSRLPDGSWALHATVRVECSYAPYHPGQPPVPPHRAQGEGEPIQANQFYADLWSVGHHHGPAFEGVTEVLTMGEGRVVASVALPTELPPNPHFHAHPVLVDTSCQVLAALNAACHVGDSGHRYLLKSFGSIRFTGTPRGRGYVHVEMRERSTADGGGFVGEMWLTDEDGAVLVEMTGVDVQRFAAPHAPLREKVLESVWRPTPLPAPDEATTDATQETPATVAGPASWLLLGAGRAATGSLAEVTDAIQERLTAAGHRVVRADYRDEPGIRGALAETGADRERPPAGIVLVADDIPATTEDPSRGLATAEALVLGLASAVRAVVSGWHGRPPRLWLVSRGAAAVSAGASVDPTVGALRGLIRVLSYEHPDLHASQIDLDPAEDTGHQLTALLTELHGAGSDDEVAWRGGVRYAARLAKAVLDDEARDGADRPDPASTPVVRPGAGYLITGGLGGLGLVVARWLVEGGASRIVLNGRSEPGADAEKAIAAMLAAGADVEVVLGDISDTGDGTTTGTARRLVAAATAGNVPLAGVVHAAAVLDDAMILGLDRASTHRVWSPKAYGAWALHEATAGHDLDFFVLFSSAASLLGSPGQAAYATANAWLDSFVTWRRSRGLPATAVNWGPWAEVGLAVGGEAEAGRSRPTAVQIGAMEPILPANGIEALEELLVRDRVLTAVALLRPDRIIATFPQIFDLPFFSEIVDGYGVNEIGDDWPGPRALREAEPAAARQLLSDRLRGRVAAAMGLSVDRLDLATPLTEFGLDSLTAVNIRNSVSRDFGTDLPVALVLQGATLPDLERELCEQLGVAEKGPDRADAETPETVAVSRARQRAAARARRSAGRNQ
ncbi:hypothetical protein GCM10012275_16220 [Longimycelium tulufanense]|uniref:Polyketide synthase n=1 Tax=Longimycelium tulufanense TaxID=907463 RepID=A0A8J3C726_9PSEU|nr:type I polyketide synthase [Longimycelium tulufanense]GGM45990.1 hypothetical protein GCM10012275_16220 [Longimycelium tulufanense]